MAQRAGYLILVDGYNVLYAVQPRPTARQLSAARQALIERLQQAGWPVPVGDICVFFDSREPAETSGSRGRVRIRFVPCADTAIQAVIREHPAPREVLVVSGDQEIVRTAKSHGAQVRSPLWLSGHLWQARARQRPPSEAGRSDLPAATARQITDELARRWLTP